jgi:GNAT superfamily N-acetyltransferase
VATDAGIERFAAPESPGAERWSDFVELTEVRNVCRRIDGGHERDVTPEYFLGAWREAGQKVPDAVVARVAGRIVGFADYERDTPDVAPTGWVDVFVLPEHRRRGIGAELYAAIERIAADDGRSTLICEFSTPPRPGPTVASTSGSGEVPAEDPGVRFALARGYSLGQVERLSICPLPVPAERLDALEASARARVGDAYKVVTWRGATPDEHLDDMAVLRARMSTDVPVDDLDWPGEVWDVDRVRASEQRFLDTGVGLFLAAVQHVPTGRLVAFTELSVRPWSATAQQGDTLVLAEHRGRRLGLLLKVVNLRALLAAHPAVTSIMTGNATSNSYMLAINDALGFETYVFDGAWQKRL